MKRRKGPAGILLIEVLLSIAVLSLVVLIFTLFYSRSSKALTSFKIRKEVAGYAQAEVTRWESLAKLGTIDPNTGLPLLTGYNSVVSDGSTQAVYYPDAVMGSETTTFSKDRFLLNRTIVISTVNAGAPDEYRQLTVTLSDTESSPRFSPLTVSAQIRKPDTLALDLRQSVGAANLTVQVLDASTNQPIPAACAAQVVVSSGTAGAMSYTGSAGTGWTVSNLPLQGTYSATFSAAGCGYGYWPQTVGGISLSAGSNAPTSVNPVRLQPVYFATVTVHVADPSGNPLSGAQVLLEAPGFSTVQFPNGASFYLATGYTDSTGQFTEAIPIGSSGTTTTTGWEVYSISLSGYYGVSPQPPFTLTVNQSTAAYFTLYPILYGSMSVSVNDATTSLPVQTAYVSVYDGSANTGCIINSLAYPFLPNSACLIAGGTGTSASDTSSNGTISFPSIPINSQANPAATTRTVQVVVQQIAYQAAVVTAQIGVSANTNVSASLAPSTITVSTFYNTLPYTSTAPVFLDVGQTGTLQAQTIYSGYSGTMNLVGNNPAGIASISKSWAWANKNPGVGYCTPSSCPASIGTSDTLKFTAEAVGATTIASTMSYSFSYNGGIYGPRWTSPDYSAYNPFNITLLPGTAGIPLLVSIVSESGSPITPNSTDILKAVATYGSDPLPADLTYTWTITGATPATGSGKKLTVTAGPPGQINATVTAQSVSVGQIATANLIINVSYSSLQASILPGTLNLNSYQNSALSGSASGGSGSYAYTWSLSNPSSTAGSINNFVGTSTTFNANVSGTVNVVLTVNDTVADESVSAICPVTVTASGSSN